MAKEYLSASKINRLMDRLKTELDIQLPTELHTVQQTYSEIMESKGVNRGRVRTYQETVDYLKANAEKLGQPYRPLTTQKYGEMVRDLNTRLEGYLSVPEAEKTYRNGAEQLIRDYNEKTGAKIDVKTIDFQTLKDVIDKATESMGKRAKERNDSPKLFRYMHQYFAEFGVDDIGEAPPEDA